MELTAVVGKAVGKFVLKTGIKKAYVKVKRWYYHNIRDEKTPVEKLQESAKRIEELETRNKRKEHRIETKEEKIEQREEELSDVKRDLSLKERLMETLDNKGVSRQELYRKNLDDPTPFLIFRLGGQDPKDPNGNGWVRSKLEEKFDATTVASSYVIPPDNFPEELVSGKATLPAWIKSEIDEDGKKANFVYVAWVDLEKGELYWRRDYESRSPMQDLEHRFNMDEYTDKDFYEFDEVKDALQLVKKGDIGFFSAKFVDEEEMGHIHKNQPIIEEELDNPSLKELAMRIDVAKIRNAMANYVADPDNVARGIKNDSKIWYDEIYGSSEVSI